MKLRILLDAESSTAESADPEKYTITFGIGGIPECRVDLYRPSTMPIERCNLVSIRLTGTRLSKNHSYRQSSDSFVRTAAFGAFAMEVSYSRKGSDYGDAGRGRSSSRGIH